MYVQGWKKAVSHRKMRITFRVIVNHFGKVNRKTANHFSNDIAKDIFLVLNTFLNKISPFSDTFYVYDA